MPKLQGSKTHDNLKEAFAGESQANRRYLYFAQKADVEGYPDVAALFRLYAGGPGVRPGPLARGVTMHKLELDDIKDLREYERERDEFRRHIVEMKKRRRVQLGDLLTITFENTDTMRFQVQEMA